MMEDAWMGCSQGVGSFSWSPSGGHLASGFYDGTILIQNAESGQVEVDPIEMKQRVVYCLAYSPSGERLASGGDNDTICIWNIRTGELLVGSIEDLGRGVTPVVWSSDSSRLYSTSNECARIIDSVSGTQLRCFKYDNWLYSVALSTGKNMLACVGDNGVAQLWGTRVHQPLGQPFGEQKGRQLNCVILPRRQIPSIWRR
ncbi:WD40 repeat-like protein [Rhizopogon salebrosus TDB-379]|nr:WD40 repeat-like protein [Rhizopogon salebrosus TDB-379]